MTPTATGKSPFSRHSDALIAASDCDIFGDRIETAAPLDGT